jgi:hypothetical protein
MESCISDARISFGFLNIVYRTIEKDFSFPVHVADVTDRK